MSSLSSSTVSFPAAGAALRRASRTLSPWPTLATTLRKTAKLAEDPEQFFFDFFARRIASRTPFGPQWQSEALRENGFYVIRNLLSREECAGLAGPLRAQHPLKNGSYTSIDAVNRNELIAELLFDRRILAAVAAGLETQPKFLQCSDLQIDHDHTRWHRDSAYRDPGGLDWDEAGAPYKTVKIIVYLETDSAGLAIVPGSHKAPSETHEAITSRFQKDLRVTIVGPESNPNRPYNPMEREHAVVFCAGVGDAIVFDERLLHRGRRVDEGRVTDKATGRKLTVSYVFGADNVHSERFHSYYRYARPDLVFKDMPPALMSRLAKAGIALNNGYRNYYEMQAEELRGVWLRKPEALDALIDSFKQ